jgi:hypothetical protein
MRHAALCSRNRLPPSSSKVPRAIAVMAFGAADEGNMLARGVCRRDPSRVGVCGRAGE